jgi:alkyl hydroperoxide reductase subunit AhpC
LTNYGERESDFGDLRTQVLGVVQESTWVARAWADHLQTALPVLADRDHTVARAYGIFAEDPYVVRRTTFTIDGEAVIRAIHQDREAIDVAASLEACAILFSVDSTGEGR